jgi:hypothetical protein
MEAPGQLRGVRVSIWSNALGASLEKNSEIFVYVPTSTLTLKMLMFNIGHFLQFRMFIYKLRF